MLQSKLSKLMKVAGVESYEEYYRILKNSNYENHWKVFTHEITVHKTAFFRESNHFLFLQNRMEYILENNPKITANKEIRVWSAGCSTGEEPYTIAMVLRESLPLEINIKILATDVSNAVVAKAQKGVYVLDGYQEIEGWYLKKYFTKAGHKLVVSNNLRELITFRTFNLMNPFPFKNTFDIIFCRNVMIYFDSAVQEQLIRKFYQVLSPGGFVFIGHSESLMGRQYSFRYIQPAIYMKPQ